MKLMRLDVSYLDRRDWEISGHKFQYSHPLYQWVCKISVIEVREEYSHHPNDQRIEILPLESTQRKSKTSFHHTWINLCICQAAVLPSLTHSTVVLATLAKSPPQKTLASLVVMVFKSTIG